MSFYILLALVNVLCFIPLYALNFRERPNPFEFLTDDSVFNKNKLKLFYAKHGLTDPFRLSFDFTFVMLSAAALDYSAPWLVWCAASLLAFNFCEILYTSIMHSIFKRPPAIASDLSLVNAGLGIAQRHRFALTAATIALVTALVFASYRTTSRLFELMPDDTVLPLLGAALMLPPCLYHWKKYPYADYLYRTVYSPTLHMLRNLQLSRRLKIVLAKSGSDFDRHNHFKSIVLSGAPNVITICVESYGSVVFRDQQYSSELRDLLAGYESRLSDAGYRFASNFSEPPIFAGGSWLSYTSFAYGFLLDSLQLYDLLFTHDNAFESYESLFHVLKRNGYKSIVLCPLGGIDLRSVDWATIDRCFQSDRNIDFHSLDYRGRWVSFFGKRGIHAAPDQYSLNFAYETLRPGESPFSLFFCTLNSHFPWDSPLKAVRDWRALGEPEFQVEPTDRRGAITRRYCDAIRYQLDYILRFIIDHADDDLLVVLFGDHQPPFITPENMGKQTPVHVIGRSETLMNVLIDHGFVPSIDLSGEEPRAIKHEGFLSLFLKGMQAAYGENRELDIDYRMHGVALFDEQGLRTSN